MQPRSQSMGAHFAFDREAVIREADEAGIAIQAFAPERPERMDQTKPKS